MIPGLIVAPTVVLPAAGAVIPLGASFVNEYVTSYSVFAHVPTISTSLSAAVNEPSAFLVAPDFASHVMVQPAGAVTVGAAIVPFASTVPSAGTSPAPSGAVLANE